MTTQTQNGQVRHARILIIDDNTDIHQDVRKVLALPQQALELRDLEADIFNKKEEQKMVMIFDIDSAYQGQEGFELVKKAKDEGKPYAMALVDMRMPPGWNGLETIQHIWEVDPLIEIVICTAFSDQPWDEVISNAGQRDKLLILKKPFDIAEVQQMLRVLTAKWVLSREVEKMRRVLMKNVDMKKKSGQ